MPTILPLLAALYVLASAFTADFGDTNGNPDKDN